MAQTASQNPPEDAPAPEASDAPAAAQLTALQQAGLIGSFSGEPSDDIEAVIRAHYLDAPSEEARAHRLADRVLVIDPESPCEAVDVLTQLSDFGDPFDVVELTWRSSDREDLVLKAGTWAIQVGAADGQASTPRVSVVALLRALNAYLAARQRPLRLLRLAPGTSLFTVAALTKDQAKSLRGAELVAVVR